MATDPHNVLFSLASDFINYTNKPVFLTGKAGTGKTTFLKHIKANTTKQTAVVAPTGVAAINAGGVTIHSFFQLPFTPFIPVSKGLQTDAVVDKHHLLGRIKLTTERRNVLKQLELLVIDEISMVRSDVLDAIDIVLRHFRNKYEEPFGGVQLLFIGDMFQLPPVVTNDEWNILSQFYDSPYFFDSYVLKQQQPVHIELDKIYRQNEQAFIDLLNKVRNNEMDADGFSMLNKLYNPADTSPREGYIILTTHNSKADVINEKALAQLHAKPLQYKAAIEGEFNEKAFPAEESLQLKEGAQVMFIKNDSEKTKRFFNGKIGVITKLESDTISVQCKDETDVIEVKKEKWENVSYGLNRQTQQVEEAVLGSFTQFPLRLAWAITIHKSQGLTFERAVIDAGAAFAAGQVYVALSRCTTLSGIILKSTITKSGLINDPRIVSFARQKRTSQHLLEELALAKKQYQYHVLSELFNFDAIDAQWQQLLRITEERKESFNDVTFSFLESINSTLDALVATSKKFGNELNRFFIKNVEPEKDALLQQRLAAAAGYFVPHLQNLCNQLSQSPAVTDSKQFAMAYNEDIRQLYSLLYQRQYFLSVLKEGFVMEQYFAKRKAFVTKTISVNAYAVGHATAKTDTPHPQLYKQLKQLRDELCKAKDTPVYMVASSATLEELCVYLPTSKQDLAYISGFGKAKIEKYGSDFLDVIISYCDEHQLSSLIEQKAPKKKAKEKKEKKEDKVDTKQVTYAMYKGGKTVKEIATERKLTTQTIESHLAFYVEQGIIDVSELVTKEKLVIIEPLVRNRENDSLIPIKQQLHNDISYGEIKITMAWLAFKNKHSK